MNFITADEASMKASDGPGSTDVILNQLYRDIKKAAHARELKVSKLIPRDELDLYKGVVRKTLEEHGYTVVVEEFKKVAPIMKSSGLIIIGW